MRISIPLDEDGFLGRQCPDCSLLFRMDAQQYEALPDDLTLWCVYCGHHAEHSGSWWQWARSASARSRSGVASTNQSA
ncbi:hypothetical protein [Streptomyces sp. NPDC054808]